MNKFIEDYFADWEADAFGFGYGTGEEHTLKALKGFFDALRDDGTYNHEDIEKAIGPQVAWLLINTLCHHRVDVIEYGMSPRNGWMTPHGRRLADYVRSQSLESLLAAVDRDSNSYTYCMHDACNCGPLGYEAGRKCDNPFWNEKRQ